MVLSKKKLLGSSKSKKIKNITANFYDISNKVPNYKDDDRVPIMQVKKLDSIIKSQIIKKKMKTGDIFFIGSSHDRQEYGFGIVLNDSYLLGNSSQFGPYLVFLDEIFYTIKSKNIKYKKALKKIETWQNSRRHPERSGLFFSDFIGKDESLKAYIEEGLYE